MINALTILTLFSVTAWDFWVRRVFVVQLIAVFLLGLVPFFGFGHSAIAPTDVLLNMLWVLIQILVLYAYCRFIRKVSLSENFGSGDVWFMLAITALFKTDQFIATYVFGVMFSLVLGKMLLAVERNQPRTIPFAGLMALWILIVLAFNIEFDLTAFSFGYTE